MEMGNRLMMKIIIQYCYRKINYANDGRSKRLRKDKLKIVSFHNSYLPYVTTVN